MALADKIRHTWKPVHLTAEQAEALVQRTELALETVSPEAVAAFCRTVGLETANKRRAAEALAAASQVMSAAKTFLPLLL